ncbi:MAG: DUF2330 domain-containing protein [Sandaracinaceae bacterium]
MRNASRALRAALAPFAPIAAALIAVASSPASTVHAFCGFYVGGADASLTNNATIVVMMRDGTKTVLSMQNDYQGPPSNFALVVPVPVVLQEDNVRTLPRSVFENVDRLSSPRLVEYWEQDPCAPELPPPAPSPQTAGVPDMVARDGAAHGVQVLARFEVGEYDIVILGANDSSGLETWLREHEYNIPEGASEALRPYVEQGTKFFVARVNVERVTFANGRAVLSPLRVHYDADTFSLPVRLGLLNSSGTQDLVIHILARNQRYDVANYPNVTIPTNLDVADDVRTRFSEFYAALFDATLERNPGAVVTEYAWQATSCDPCPGPVISVEDLMTLGGDVVNGGDTVVPPSPWGGGFGTDFVLTRLHYRYGRDGLDDDLVFRQAPAIVGGREMMRGTELEHGAAESSFNNFQGRYAIRHPWEGAIACEHPIRGRWGGHAEPGRIDMGGAPPPARAEDTAFAPRGNLALPSVLRTDAPEIEVEAGLDSIQDLIEGTAHAQEPEGESDSESTSTPAAETSSSGCGACAVGRRGRGPLPGGPLAFAAVTIGALARVRRRRR